jgi:hypothetical protein
MAKRRAKSLTTNLTFHQQKSGIALIFLHVSGVPHNVGKLSMRDTTLLESSFQSKVFTKSYGPPKSQKF